jgi:hypothetical protein
MSVGRYFGVGPATLPEWKKALGTSEEKSTDPQAIVAGLRDLGLHVEARDGMTIDDLAAYCARGMPVIVCVQDYGPYVSAKAEWPYGHYLTVIGVLNPTPPGRGYVFCQDSSADNVIGNSGSIQAAGRVMIDQADFLKMWHDRDEHGRKYVQFGIAVGPAMSEEGRRGASGDVERTIYTTAGLGKQKEAEVTPAGALAMQFEYMHQARIPVQAVYDELSGPQMIEDGVRVQWAAAPEIGAKKAVLYQFDSTRFSEAAAKKWLNDHAVTDYLWQPDSRDRTPVTQGSPRDKEEEPPEGFVDLASFLAATVPIEAEGAKA